MTKLVAIRISSEAVKKLKTYSKAAKLSQGKFVESLIMAHQQDETPPEITHTKKEKLAIARESLLNPKIPPEPFRDVTQGLEISEDEIKRRAREEYIFQYDMADDFVFPTEATMPKTMRAELQRLEDTIRNETLNI